MVGIPRYNMFARVQNTCSAASCEGYFEQNVPKVAPVVHFTTDQYLFTGAVL